MLSGNLEISVEGLSTQKKKKKYRAVHTVHYRNYYRVKGSHNPCDVLIHTSHFGIIAGHSPTRALQLIACYSTDLSSCHGYRVTATMRWG